MKTFKELLLELYACNQAREWAADKTIEEVVEQCDRGDWLLWLGKKVAVDDRKFTLAKGHCVNTVRHLMKDERSIKAVDIAVAYGKGEVTEEELAVATVNAYAAAADACYAYRADAYAYGDAATAYHAAAAAADACAADACDAAARAANKREAADICRKYIGQEIIESVNQMLNQ